MKLKDIANDLHLSISTVSKALNGAFDVSNDTKKTVIEYAKAHGYKTKDESLFYKTKRKIVMLYDKHSLANQANIVASISISFAKYAREKNFEISIMPLDAITLDYNQFMQKNNFDGSFIVGLNSSNPIYNELINTTIPTVLYDSFLISNKVSTIHNDDIHAMVSLIKKLKELGHTKIGFILGDSTNYISSKRYAGYIIGLETNKLEYNPRYLYKGSLSKECGKQAANYFKHSDVSAIICSSDLIAVGLIEELKNNKINVFNNFSITGFDDLEMARHSIPSITTIRQNLNEIAKNAFQLLVLLMMDYPSKNIFIESEIIYRDSTHNKK